MKSWYSPDPEDRLFAQGAVDAGSLTKNYEDAELQSFFRDLTLLKRVPLSYLVCDRDFLQPESLHLFYVDPNWISCFIQGALSLGDRGEADRNYHRNIAPHLVKAAVAGQTETVSGFLLNSQIVSGWPGLSIRCFAQGKPLPIYRLDRLNESLMICLVGGDVDSVEFTEPQEGISLGFTQEASGVLCLEPVSLDKESMGMPAAADPIYPEYRENGVPGVLNLRKMAQTIQERLELSPEKRALFSALDFTVEMLKRRVRYTVSYDQEAAYEH